MCQEDKVVSRVRNVISSQVYCDFIYEMIRSKITSIFV